MSLTPEQALARLLAGEHVRMTVGEGGPEDPVCDLYIEDGMAYQYVISGWSAGVLEPICEANSDFLRTHLLGRHALVAT